MKAVGVKPNIKTYTTLIHGWSRASLPEKALRCFEEMKMAGLKPDKAVYHCLMTSLLSRATVAEEYMCSGILSLCGEMHISSSEKLCARTHLLGWIGESLANLSAWPPSCVSRGETSQDR